MNPTHTHAPLDVSEITPLIFIGKNACCVTHFDESLRARGVRADISLEQERVDQPYGVDFYLWLPTQDHTAMTHERADLGVATLRFFAERHIPCFVHCKNGHGRAPMLVAAYLMAERGMNAQEAVALIKQRRPSAHLQDAQLAFLREREARRAQPEALFACKECGFKYRTRRQAQACEHSCADRGVCRSDLAQQAIKE